MFVRFRFPVLFLIALLLFCSQIALSQQTSSNSLPDGRAIFLQHCAECHGTQGQGIGAIISLAGPPLIAEHDRQQTLQTIEQGKGIMPTFSRVLSPGEIQAVADYVNKTLATLPLAGGNVPEGGTLFLVYCAPCHRTAVRGGILVFAGVNPPALVNKSSAEIAGAIRWGPGPMPAFPPSEISDQQLASIVDYVNFAKSPPHPGGTPMNWYGPVAEGCISWIALCLLVLLTGWIEKGGKG